MNDQFKIRAKQNFNFVKWSQIEQKGIRQGLTWSNKAELGKTWSNGVQQDKTGSNYVKQG